MRGNDTAKTAGHQWVVDGFDKYSTWTEYYNKETGELAAMYPGSGYTYLHFNAGWEGTSYNAYYLCYGTTNLGDDKKDFSTFKYNSDNYIITGIKI